MDIAWICFDCETSGLEPGSRLLELAAVACNVQGHIGERFSALCNPEQTLPVDSEAIHGIDTAELTTARPTAQVLQDFFKWLPARACLIAHNIYFDAQILAYEADRAGLRLPRLQLFDSLAIARLLGDYPNNQLATIVAHHGWQLSGPAHRAEPDSEAVARLWQRGLQKYGTSRCRHHADCGRLKVQWTVPQVLPNKFTALDRAIAKQQAFHFSYTNAQGISSDRRIIPYGYAERRCRLNFHGLCLDCQERRNFLAERATPL